MPTHSFNTLMRRLSRAGFNRQLVATALLPDWWEQEHSSDQTVLPEIEVRVSRFLGIPISTVRDPTQPLYVPPYSGAQLRRVRDINRDRLGPAIHTAAQVGAAVVRNLRTHTTFTTLPGEAREFRQLLDVHGGTPIQLESILNELWTRGVPVIQLDTLPSPKFQGLAIFVEGHPVICLGHRHDEPGRVTFIVSHEVAHIATGDCSPTTPILHEIDGGYDDSEMEQAADQFAVRVLLGNCDTALQAEDDIDAKRLAQEAFDMELKTGAEASAIIYSWAARTLDYSKASMAVRALYRSSGALRLVRTLFEEYVDLEDAPESDREILRCVYSGTDASTVAL